MLRRLLPYAVATLLIVPGAIFLAPTLAPSLAAPSTVASVVRTPSGKKYHRAGCPTLARSRKALSLNRADAEKRGLRACKVCRP
jgi:hypothetical protein